MCWLDPNPLSNKFDERKLAGCQSVKLEEADMSDKKLYEESDDTDPKDQGPAEGEVDPKADDQDPNLYNESDDTDPADQGPKPGEVDPGADEEDEPEPE